MDERRKHEAKKLALLVVTLILCVTQFATQNKKQENTHLSSRVLMSMENSSDYLCRLALKQNDSCEVYDDYCESESDYDYYYLFACAFPDRYWIPTVILIGAVVYMFLALSVVAEDYFCPSLVLLSDSLGISENVAAVTFVALGNGANDIFASFSAIFQESPELSLGAILGAGIFVNTAVVGTINLAAPFQLTRRPFFRDIIFYMISVSYIWYVCSDNLIRVGEISVASAWYLIYIAVVIIGRRIYQSRKEKKEDSSENEGLIKKAEEKDYQSQTNTSQEPYSINNQPNTLTKSKSQEFKLTKEEFDTDQKVRHSLNDRQNLDLRPSFRKKLLEKEKAIEETEYEKNEEACVPPLEKLKDGLFPIITEWHRRSYGKRLFLVLTIPAYFVFAITVPVLIFVTEKERKKKQFFNWWSKYLVVLSLFFSPIFIAWSVDALDEDDIGRLPVWAFCLLTGFFIAFIAFFLLRDDKPPRFYWLLSSICFLNSVLWIYFLAEELVNVLQVIGNTLGISEVLLGLTVLAWGNSVEDLVSNTAMAKLGLGNMAFSACIGNPLTNLLLGFGLCVTYYTIKTGEPLVIEIDRTLTISFALILVILLSHIIFFSFNKFRGHKFYGIYLYAIFISYTTYNVVVEFIK